MRHPNTGPCHAECEITHTYTHYLLRENYATIGELLGDGIYVAVADVEIDGVAVIVIEGVTDGLGEFDGI